MSFSKVRKTLTPLEFQTNLWEVEMHLEGVLAKRMLTG